MPRTWVKRRKEPLVRKSNLQTSREYLRELNAATDMLLGLVKSTSSVMIPVWDRGYFPTAFLQSSMKEGLEQFVFAGTQEDLPLPSDLHQRLQIVFESLSLVGRLIFIRFFRKITGHI